MALLSFLYQGTTSDPKSFDHGLMAGNEAYYTYKGLPAVNPGGIYVFANPELHQTSQLDHDSLTFPSQLMFLAGELFRTENEEYERLLAEGGTLGDPVADEVFRLLRRVDLEGNPIERAALFAIMKMFHLHTPATKLVESGVFPSVITIDYHKVENLRMAADLTFAEGAYLLAQSDGKIAEVLPRSAFTIASLSPEEVRQTIEQFDKYDRLVVLLEKLSHRVQEGVIA